MPSFETFLLHSALAQVPIYSYKTLHTSLNITSSYMKNVHNVCISDAAIIEITRQLHLNTE